MPVFKSHLLHCCGNWEQEDWGLEMIKLQYIRLLVGILCAVLT